MAAQPDIDPRIHVDADHLRRLAPQARSLPLLPGQPARSVLNGRHASRLRGRGLNFEELRGYLPGDDVRSIDWKVTARTGEPHVRVYTEERDRPALLLVDQRQTMFFGTVAYMKSVIAAEAAALAAHRILHQGDRIGGIVFTDDMVAEHRPQRRPASLQRFLGSVARANLQLSAARSVDTRVTLNDVLRSATRNARSGGLVLVISDFDGLDAGSEPLLRRLSALGDLILCHVADPSGRAALPDALRLTISDGDLQAELNTEDADLRARVTQALNDRLAQLYDWSRKYGFPILPLSTDRPALDQIQALLGQRATQRARR